MLKVIYAHNTEVHLRVVDGSKSCDPDSGNTLIDITVSFCLSQDCRNRFSACIIVIEINRRMRKVDYPHN